MYIVEVVKDRPDFRSFIDLLYGFGRNIDTEGDSNPVNSRTWTHLYVADRESGDPCVEAYVSPHDPVRFVVESSSSILEELTALYLFLSSGASISSSEGLLDPAMIDRLREKYASELNRADRSIWHQSCDAHPYPNRG